MLATLNLICYLQEVNKNLLVAWINEVKFHIDKPLKLPKENIFIIALLH